MSTKHGNPYRNGSAYATVFAMIQSKQVITRQALETAMTGKATEFDVGVVLSPRIGKFGNASSKGNIYYMEALKKENVGDDKRFRLRWYAPNATNIPAKPTRNVKPVAVVASEKTAAKTAKTVKAATKGKVTA